MSELQVQNVVFSGRFEGPVDLRVIPGARYDPGRFSAASVRRAPVTFVIFPSGAFNCLGAKTIPMGEEAIWKLSKEVGVGIREHRVVNIVGSFNIGHDLDLVGLYKSLRGNMSTCSLEPELFSGVTFKISGLTVRVFHNGKGFIVNAIKEGDLRDTHRTVRRILLRHVK